MARAASYAQAIELSLVSLGLPAPLVDLFAQPLDLLPLLINLAGAIGDRVTQVFDLLLVGFILGWHRNPPLRRPRENTTT